MKTLSVTIFRKIQLLILLSGFVPAFTLNAQELSNNPNPVEITYMGNRDGYLVFKVNINNPESEKLTLQLRDEKKEVLYEQTFSELQVSKTFLINREELTDFNFKVSGKKVSYSRDFSLRSKVVEEMIEKEATR